LEAVAHHIQALTSPLALSLIWKLRLFWAAPVCKAALVRRHSSARGVKIWRCRFMRFPIWLEIEDVLVRYCYAVHDRDWNAYRDVFTNDAVIDDTVTGGVQSGVEEHMRTPALIVAA
jgi:hypothetical protein